MSVQILANKDPHHVISKTPLKKGDQANNDVPPQRTAAVQNVILTEIKEKRQPLEENMQNLKDVLENVQKRGTATSQEIRKIVSLLTQVQKQMEDLESTTADLRNTVTGTSHEQLDANSDQDSTLPGAFNPDENNPSCIMGGPLVIAEAILQKLQQEYQKLQTLMTQIALDNLKQSPAVVKFMADASQSTYDAQASTNMAEAYGTGSQIGTGVLTGIGMGVSAKNLGLETKGIEGEMGNLGKFENALKTSSAEVSVGDAPKTLEAQKQAITDDPNILAPDKVKQIKGLDDRITTRDARLGQLKSGVFGNFDENPQGHADAINHLNNHAADPQHESEFAKVQKSIQSRTDAGHTRLNTSHTRFQKRDSYLQMAQGLLNNSGTATTKTYQATYATQQGNAAAEKDVDQNISGQIDKTTDDSKKNADAQVQNLSALVDVRQKLIDSNNATIKGG